MISQAPLPRGLPDSPLAAFLALRGLPHVFWLDSGSAATDHGRYHHLGAMPSTWIARDAVDPFALLRAHQPMPTPGRALRPAARLVASFAYDLGRFADAFAVADAPEVGVEATLGVYPASVTYDLVTGERWLTAESTEAREALEAALARPPTVPEPTGPQLTGPPHRVVSDHDRASYGGLVESVKAAIGRGDVYQVNLSHRFEAYVPGASAADLYLALRRRSAPYGAFLDAGASSILSNSPEAFLRLDLTPGRRRAATYPLKGTRPSGGDPEELRASVKDRAEHVMIVDLERNDLGRIAVPGSVRATRLFDVVQHPTVMHLESEVEAEVRPGLDTADVLRALFPGGSITGAPKLAAAALIAALEGRRRGIYCGTIGYLDVDGCRSVWSIPIRTGVLHGDRLAFRSGGGVVADSCPDAEWDETQVKARAFLELLGAVAA